MKENKGHPTEVSTCFDGSPAAEMIQKIMGEQKIGSLSEEMMRSLIRKLNEDIEESQNTKKEEI
jgi:carbon monoxide dehydrogenase subunit G